VDKVDKNAPSDTHRRHGNFEAPSGVPASLSLTCGDGIRWVSCSRACRALSAPAERSLVLRAIRVRPRAQASLSPAMLILDDFLSPDECDELMQLASGGAHAAPVAHLAPPLGGCRC
jgi:hypothetical protein